MVAIVPGAYAIRAVLGSLQTVHGTAVPPRATETLALGITVVLIIAALAVGIAARLFLRSVAGPADSDPSTRSGLSAGQTLSEITGPREPMGCATCRCP